MEKLRPLPAPYVGRAIRSLDAPRPQRKAVVGYQHPLSVLRGAVRGGVASSPPPCWIASCTTRRWFRSRARATAADWPHGEAAGNQGQGERRGEGLNAVVPARGNNGQGGRWVSSKLPIETNPGQIRCAVDNRAMITWPSSLAAGAYEYKVISQVEVVWSFAIPDCYGHFSKSRQSAVNRPQARGLDLAPLGRDTAAKIRDKPPAAVARSQSGKRLHPEASQQGRRVARRNIDASSA